MKADLKLAVHALLNVLTVPKDAPLAVKKAERDVRELMYGRPLALESNLSP